MSRLYLYAVAAPADVPPAAIDASVPGCGGRAVCWRVVGRLAAAVVAMEPGPAEPGPGEREPAVTLDDLRAHETVLERLAADVHAIVPMRYGQTLADARALARTLARFEARLLKTLDDVRGCRQMTLRAFAPDGGLVPAAPDHEEDGTLGDSPGTRYLRERLRRSRPAEAVLERLAPLTAALRGYARAHRREPGRGGALLATHYHLVPAGRVVEYAATVARLAPRTAPLRVRATGPWAPYAFVEGPLDA